MTDPNEIGARVAVYTLTAIGVLCLPFMLATGYQYVKRRIRGPYQFMFRYNKRTGDVRVAKSYGLVEQTEIEII